MAFYNITRGSVYTIGQSLINWKLLIGCFGSWERALVADCGKAVVAERLK